MKILFREEDHKYFLEGTDFTYKSVSKFFEEFKYPFDPNLADKYAQKSKDDIIKDLQKKWKLTKKEALDKWGNIEEFSGDIIRSIWKEKAKIATDRGTTFHKKMENQDFEKGAFPGYSMRTDGLKECIDLKNLTPGSYVEIMLPYTPQFLIGTADKVIINPDKTFILRDWKSDSEMNFSAIAFFNPKKGIKEKKYFKPPINHIEDCNGQGYNLKMSLYCYFLEFYGYKFLEGWIDHVEDIETEKITSYPMTYYKKEIEAMLKFKKLI